MRGKCVFLDSARRARSRHGGELVSCVGIWPASGSAELRTVATEADCRGYASELIQRLVEDVDLGVVWAETDNDAVGFYRSAGFEIQDLGEKYPGVVRYLARGNVRAHEPMGCSGSARSRTRYQHRRARSRATRARTRARALA